MSPATFPRRTILSFAFALAPTALLAASGQSAPQASPELKPAQTPGTVVRIENFTFGPPLLQVKLGTTVTWINQDDTPHTVVAVGGAFRSKALDTDEQYSFRFSSIGEFEYFCSLHPHMVGKVVVGG